MALQHRILKFALRNIANNHLNGGLINSMISRNIYSAQYLALDKFEDQRNRISSQFGHLKENFMQRMASCVDSNSKKLIFSEDLKNSIFLFTNSDEDVDLMKKMLFKYNSQNNDLRFGNYHFGPVIMRLLHLFKKPDVALELLENPEFNEFFNQLKTYLIAMDLLFKEGRYQKVLDIYQQLNSKGFVDTHFPRDIMILVFMSCYKINTPEAYKQALDWMRQVKEADVTVPRKAVTALASLALKQNDADVALELLSLTQQPNYITVRNIRILSMSKMGRLEDISYILRSMLNRDNPNRPQTDGQLLQSTLDAVMEAVAKRDSKEMTSEFEQIKAALIENHHLSSRSLDDILCEPIDRAPIAHEDSSFQSRSNYNRGLGMQRVKYIKGQGANFR